MQFIYVKFQLYISQQQGEDETGLQVLNSEYPVEHAEGYLCYLVEVYFGRGSRNVVGVVVYLV